MMGHKKHTNLRSLRDMRQRKKMNDSNGWAAKMLEELKAGEEPEVSDKKKKKKGNKETAKKLTNDSL